MWLPIKCNTGTIHFVCLHESGLLVELAMRQLPGRTGAAETAAGVCILAVLLGIAVAILVKQGHYWDPARAMAERPAKANSLVSTIPSPPGFKAASAVESYNPDTLYEKIDGKADMYLEAGFKSLVCQRFVSTKDEGVWLEAFVYDMDSPVSAFGVYGQQRRSDVVALDVTPFAYKTVDGVYLAAGGAYVEIHGSAATEELSNAMLAVAKSLAGTVKMDAGVAAAIATFPKEGQVAGSAALYPAEAFGCSQLDNVYTMQYGIAGKSVLAFASPRESADAAAKLAADYGKFVVDNGGRETTPKDAGFPARTFDLYKTTEIVFARGSIVAGVHGADDAAAAMGLARKLWDKLPDKAMPVSVTPAAAGKDSEGNDSEN
jgi:hypothetical protein